MDTFLFVAVLLLLFGWGGFYLGGPVIGGSGLALVLMICILLYFVGRFRAKTRED
jgi:hypothetical protein